MTLCWDVVSSWNGDKEPKLDEQGHENADGINQVTISVALQHKVVEQVLLVLLWLASRELPT